MRSPSPNEMSSSGEAKKWKLVLGFTLPWPEMARLAHISLTNVSHVERADILMTTRDVSHTQHMRAAARLSTAHIQVRRDMAEDVPYLCPQLVPTPILWSSLLSTVGFTWGHHACKDLCIHTLRCGRGRRLQVDCNLIIQ